MNPETARSPRRGFVWALLASLLLHALTLSVATLRPGSAPEAASAGTLPLVAVTLLPPAASPVPAPAPLQPPAATPRPAAAPTRPPLPAPARPDDAVAVPASARPPAPGAAAPLAATSAAPQVGAQPDDGMPGAGGVSADPIALAAPAEPPKPLPPVAAAADASQAGSGADAQVAESATAGRDAVPPPGSIRFPRSGRLEYGVTIGTPPTPVGRATYAWEASEATYRLSLSAETTGLVGLLRRVRVVQTSEGRITPDGLRPDAFAMDRGRNARNEFARFDWTAKQLTFGYPDATQTAALGAGAQDTLSLILQFAFVPIGDGPRDVLLTTGRKLYVQTYERVGEEVIETPAGSWRASHLRRVRAQAGDEGYDMWLATDRPFLPVRIRWTDRNGRVTSATLDTVRLARD